MPEPFVSLSVASSGFPPESLVRLLSGVLSISDFSSPGFVGSSKDLISAIVVQLSSATSSMETLSTAKKIQIESLSPAKSSSSIVIEAP